MADTADPLAAALEEIREGERACPRIAMRRLLAAVEMVLKLAEIAEDSAVAAGMPATMSRLSPAVVREAITRELLEEEPGMLTNMPASMPDDKGGTDGG